MTLLAAWLVAMVGVMLFLSGSKRHRDADEATDLEFAGREYGGRPRALG